MPNFLDTFKTRKQLFISAFLIGMAVILLELFERCSTRFYKNKFYKNNETDVDKRTRTNQKHFETGKFKNKKLK